MIFTHFVSLSAATCEFLPELPHASPITQVLGAPVYGDKMLYTCDPGYQVLLQSALPSTLYTSYGYYGYSAASTFELICKEDGHWSPYPLPVCQRMYYYIVESYSYLGGLFFVSSN